MNPDQTQLSSQTLTQIIDRIKGKDREKGGDRQQGNTENVISLLSEDDEPGALSNSGAKANAKVNTKKKKKKDVQLSDLIGSIIKSKQSAQNIKNMYQPQHNEYNYKNYKNVQPSSLYLKSIATALSYPHYSYSHLITKKCSICSKLLLSTLFGQNLQHEYTKPFHYAHDNNRDQQYWLMKYLQCANCSNFTHLYCLRGFPQCPACRRDILNPNLRIRADLANVPNAGYLIMNQAQVMRSRQTKQGKDINHIPYYDQYIPAYWIQRLYQNSTNALIPPQTAYPGQSQPKLSPFQVKNPTFLCQVLKSLNQPVNKSYLQSFCKLYYHKNNYKLHMNNYYWSSTLNSLRKIIDGVEKQPYSTKDLFILHSFERYQEFKEQIMHFLGMYPQLFDLFGNIKLPLKDFLFFQSQEGQKWQFLRILAQEKFMKDNKISQLSQNCNIFKQIPKQQQLPEYFQNLLTIWNFYRTFQLLLIPLTANYKPQLINKQVKQDQQSHFNLYQCRYRHQKSLQSFQQQLKQAPFCQFLTPLLQLCFALVNKTYNVITNHNKAKPLFNKRPTTMEAQYRIDKNEHLLKLLICLIKRGRNTKGWKKRGQQGCREIQVLSKYFWSILLERIIVNFWGFNGAKDGCSNKQAKDSQYNEKLQDGAYSDRLKTKKQIKKSKNRQKQVQNQNEQKQVQNFTQQYKSQKDIYQKMLNKLSQYSNKRKFLVQQFDQRIAILSFVIKHIIQKFPQFHKQINQILIQSQTSAICCDSTEDPNQSINQSANKRRFNQSSNINKDPNFNLFKQIQNQAQAQLQNHSNPDTRVQPKNASLSPTATNLQNTISYLQEIDHIHRKIINVGCDRHGRLYWYVFQMEGHGILLVSQSLGQKHQLDRSEKQGDKCQGHVKQSENFSNKITTNIQNNSQAVNKYGLSNKIINRYSKNKWGFYLNGKIEQLLESLNPYGQNQLELKSNLTRLLQLNLLTTSSSQKPNIVRQLYIAHLSSSINKRENEDSNQNQEEPALALNQLNLSELRGLLLRTFQVFNEFMGKYIKNWTKDQTFEQQIKECKFKSLPQIKWFVGQFGEMIYSMRDWGLAEKGGEGKKSRRGRREISNLSIGLSVKAELIKKLQLWANQQQAYVSWKKQLQKSTKNSQIFLLVMLLYLQIMHISKSLKNSQQIANPSKNSGQQSQQYFEQRKKDINSQYYHHQQYEQSQQYQQQDQPISSGSDIEESDEASSFEAEGDEQASSGDEDGQTRRRTGRKIRRT